MANPAELTPRAVDLPAEQLQEAVVFDDALTPEQEVGCTTSDFAPGTATDPMQWTPFVTPAGIFYPKRGDRAVLGLPTDGPPVISQWWPAEDAEPDGCSVAVSSTADVALSSSEMKPVPGCEVVAAASGVYVATGVFDFLCEGTGGAATGRITVDGEEQQRKGVFAPQIVNGRGDAIAFAVVPVSAGATIDLQVRSTGGIYKALAPHTSLLVSPAV